MSFACSLASFIPSEQELPMKRLIVLTCLLATTVLALPLAGWCYDQPAVNLGFTSFVDGAPPGRQPCS